MSVVDKFCRNAHLRLDVLQNEARDEAWKDAYLEAERCHFFELALGSALEVFKFIREIERSWRAAVCRGIEEPDQRRDASVKEGFVRWFDLGGKLSKTIVDFEQLGYRLEHHDEFQQALASAEQTLTRWVSPRPSQSPAVRVWDVSEEEADAMRALSEAPPGSPGKLTIAPRQLPERDASALR
jgi:hypothetical protein